MRRITFPSDGLDLVGYLHLPADLAPGERRGAVLCVHGFGASQDRVLPDVAVHLAQRGQATLRVLLRHPAQSVLIEHALLRLGVAYGTAGCTPFLARPETLLVRGLHAHALGDYAGFDTPERRAALLEHFGSIEKIRAATPEQLRWHIESTTLNP